MIVLVRVLGAVYQEGVTNECDRIDPNSIELFSVTFNAIIRLLEISNNLALKNYIFLLVLENIMMINTGETS